MKNLNEYLEEKLAKSTAKSYEYHIKKYLIFNTNAEKYNYTKIMEYIEILRKKHTPGTIKIILASILKYYEYLIETGQRKDNPAKAIKLKDNKENPIQLQDFLTENELENLLKPRKERYPFLEKRNQIIMSLLVNQALRIGEIIQLKTEDVNLEKATIQINKTGITNARILPLKAEQILLFYEYLQNHRNKLITHRFNDNTLLLNKLGTKIKVDDINYLISTYQKECTKKLTTTTIRQSVITNLLSKNNDLRIVQEFAGHKHLDTTEKYKETGLNALKTAIEKLHPIK